MVAPRRSARICVRPPAVWTKPLRRSEGPAVRRARDSRRRQQAQPPEGAVRARGCDAGRPPVRHGWSGASSDPGGGEEGIAVPIAEPGPLRRAEVRLVGLPGRCHAWGCGNQPVPPSSLSAGEAWVWRGRCWQARDGTNWAVWTHPERVRGWGRWGRETREAESGVRLFAAAAPGGSGPLPALPFLPAGRRAAMVFPGSQPLCQPGQGAMGLHAHPQDTSSLHIHPSAPDSPVLSCCNTPTPWTSSPCALPAPKGPAAWGGTPGVSLARPGRGVASGALSASVARPATAWMELPCGAWVAGHVVGRGPQRAAPPERHWMGFLVASAKQACYPLPWSRVREVQPVGCHKHSAGDHERGWPSAGDLRAGARGSQAGVWSCVAPRFTDACSSLRRESCVFRGLPDQCVTPRRVSSP